MERRIHERKKRYGWLVVVAAINWIIIGLMVWRMDPGTVRDFFFPNSYLPMMVALTGGVFWLLSILFMDSKRAMRWTAGVVTYLYMRIWGLGSFVNVVFIVGLLVSMEFYLSKNGKGQKKEDMV